MNQDTRTIELMLKGAIAELPQEDQDEVKRIADNIRNIVQTGGELGTVALGLVSLEFQRLYEDEED